MSANNFVIATPQGGQVTVVEAVQPTEDDRQQAVNLLRSATVSGQALRAQADAFVAARPALSSAVGSNFLYLEYLLTSSHEPARVLVDIPPENLVQWEAEADVLRGIEVSLRAPGEVDEDSLSKLVMIVVGAPLYARARDPQLFQGLTLSGLPAPSALTTPPRSHRTAATDAAQRKFEELKKEFARNHRTYSRLLEYERRVNRGEFDKFSFAQARSHIVPHFYKRAQSSVSAWLRLALAARHTKPEPAIPRSLETKTAQELIGLSGTNIAFVSETRFPELAKEVARECHQ